MEEDEIIGEEAIQSAFARAAEELPVTKRDDEFERKLAHYRRNDYGNARRMIDRFGENLIYVRDVGWHAWTGTHWSNDDGEYRAQKYAHKTAQAIYDEAKVLEEDEYDKTTIQSLRKWASSSGNAGRIRAMLSEAEPYLLKRIEELNADPFLFSVSNGTLNLRGSIKLQKHSRQDFITMMSPVAFDQEATGPIFQEFLNRSIPDVDIQLFLQRWSGYCMTGDISEQCLTLFHGSGSNGKSTFVGIMSYIYGDAAMVLPFASLLHDDRKRGSEASPDIARLPGKKFVSAAEPEVGARFSESMLKSLTGGDVVTARHLNQGFFEFTPKFKLCLSFNNKPTVRGQDDGIWRRLLLVPFEQTIPKEQRDQRLPAKLREEASGILNWVLDGVRLWHEKGLDIPNAVRAATDDYRAESDTVGQFLSVATETSERDHVQAKTLYNAYKRWCDRNAIEPMSSTGFGRRLTDRGLKKSKLGSMFYEGIKLKEEFDPDRDQGKLQEGGEDIR